MPGRDDTNDNQVDATTAAGGIMSMPDATSESGPGPRIAENEQRKVSGNSFLNWLFVRNELARAREEAGRFSAEQREYLRRAKVAFELAELALAPANAVRSGSTAPHAAN